MKTKGSTKTVILFVLPIILAVFGTLFYPFISSIGMSFTNKMFQIRSFRFIGLDNYIEVITDPLFRKALWNSVKLTLIVVTGDLIIGLPVALLLNHGGRYTGFFRVALFIPWLLPSTVITTIFKWILNSNYGFLSYYLRQLGLINRPLQIMSDPDLVWIAVSFVIIWCSFPFVTLVLAAALKSVDKDLYQVARLDGANSFQLFRHITLPCIKPAIITIVILEIIWEMSEYDIVKLLTNGGPGKSTYTLSLYMYNEAFYAKRMGYAGAIGMIFFILVFSFTMLYFKVSTRKDEV